MFDRYLNFDTLDLAENIEIIYAHRKDFKKKETLKEHSELTKDYLDLLVKDKNLSQIIDSLLLSVSTNNTVLLKEMFYNAIYLHDLGKVNPAFQRNKMNNERFHETTASSNHSLPSAKRYVEVYKDTVMEKEDYSLIFILYNFAYQISKHHGKLTNLGNFELNIELLDNAFKESVKNRASLNIPEFELYILNKLLFSLLVSSDYYATTEYMADLKTNNFGIFTDEEKAELIKTFETTDIVRNIRSFEAEEFQFEKSDINRLRCEMFLEAEKNLLANVDENIFYLEAPTGSGKTLTSINLALKLLQKDQRLNKLFYVFPFNTLVEQTKTTFDNIFSEIVDTTVINSITPIEDEKQEDSETNYSKSYLNRLFYHNPIILTTHISLFNTLFGITKEDNYPLWQFANSIVIIDEIQSYNNELWWYMIEFFQKYAELLNIKIIIMSATLPKLDALLEKSSGFVDLITNREYFFGDRLFKDRVKIDFSLLDNETYKKSEELRLRRVEKLLSIFQSEKNASSKFLFEFIKKDSAREFFNLLKDKVNDFEIYELTGDDNKAYRDFVISKTKIKDKKIIIVATQVIEAGVDIDMDIGFKDISTIDSEEQFMGRVNRSCKKKNSKVYFFYLDNEQKIYEGDNRREFNLRNSDNRKLLKEKDFQGFYKNVLNRIKENGNKLKSGFNSEMDNFKKAVSLLDYSEIRKMMTLIDSQNYTLFFPFKIDISLYKIREFEEIESSLLTNGFLDGVKVWSRFKELNKIQDFAEMKVKKSRINSLLPFFTFNIIKYINAKPPCNFYRDPVGGIYYIKDYHDYVTDDLKFKRKEYQEACNSNFY